MCNMALACLKSNGQIFHSISIHLGLCGGSSGLDCVMDFWKEEHRADVPLATCRGYNTACLAGGNGHCDHLTKGVSVRFLQGKVTSLPFSLEGSPMFKEEELSSDP